MSVRVAWRVSIGLVGTIMLYLAIPLAFPVGVAVIYGEPLMPFLITIAITVVLGSSLYLVGTDDEMYIREAFLAVALSWFLVAVVGAIPFILAGSGTTAHPLNALFESMSGITTTGATVILAFDVHSRSLMMWRQVIQWLGGLGILIAATVVLSTANVGGAQLLESETWTETLSRLTPRLAKTARILLSLYTGITVMVIAVLYGLHLAGIAPNMDLYNAIAHALTSVSTAGFSPEPASGGAFVPLVQWVLIGSMFVGATSFVLLFLMLTDDPFEFLKNEEFLFYVGVILAAAGLIAAALWRDPTVNLGASGTVRHSLFNTISILTTTGYASVNFDHWSPAAKHVLFACMFFGGMVGSTTCSIKLQRWLIVGKALRRELYTVIQPSAIRPLRLSGEPIDEESIRDVYGFVLLSLIMFFLLTVFIVADAARIGLEVSEFEAMGASAATFLNIGPGFGLAGPYESYHSFPPTTKMAMILLMWIGRIEIIPVLVLFTRTFWQS